MGFDGHGGMWVSELELNRLVRFDAHGDPGASLILASPGASGLEADGRMFALYGDSDLGTPPAGVVTFDPTAATPVATPFVSGFTMANGGAVDAAGNLYVANSLTPGILKFSPTGVLDRAFEQATQITGADGVAIDGRTLYVTQITSASATIVQVPLDDPKAHAVLASLAPLIGPDDLAIGPDGALYVALAGGQLVRVDRSTGAACTVIDAGVPLTSVRFPTGFPPYSADSGDAFVTSELGEILHVHLSGLKVPPATAARIRVYVSPRRTHLGRHTITITTRSDSPTCATLVSVRVGRHRSRTNANGQTRVRLRFTRTGTDLIVARKTGCQSGCTKLRVISTSQR